MLKLKGFNHMAFAVRSIDEALGIFRDVLGGTVIFGPVIPPDRQHKMLLVSLGGITIELMEPTDDHGFLARFLAKRGEGFNHIGFNVEGIKSASEILQSAGLEMIREKLSPPGPKYAFFHPKSFFGIELHLEEDWLTHSDVERM